MTKDTLEQIIERIDKINDIKSLKEELKLMWRIIYSTYVINETKK